jgi:DNA modification methylase
MKYIHPFPARMAPEIVLKNLELLKDGQNVLDPMVGSGMVLNTASRKNIKSYGVDLDPLAVLISKTTSTKIDIDVARKSLSDLIIKLEKINKDTIFLPWIDDDIETSNFIKYWFDKKQIQQLRKIVYFLVEQPITSDSAILDVLKISLSRLIITKEPKASLARDTAHSRPHRTILKNDFDIINALPNSLNHVLKALKPSEINCDSKVSIGNAQKLSQFKNNYFDMILTSPPYLNAIDYMRSHKFSLIWLGFTLAELRNIKTDAIGITKSINPKKFAKHTALLKKIKNYDLDSPMIQEYFIGLYTQLVESYRVLKYNGIASFVIGNSNIKENAIYNNKLLKIAATLAGFSFISEMKREIPNNRRYMPISGDSPLSKRMKMEYILTFKKLKNDN